MLKQTYFRQFVASFKKSKLLFSFTRSRSRPKTGRLRNPAFNQYWNLERRQRTIVLNYFFFFSSKPEPDLQTGSGQNLPAQQCWSLHWRAHRTLCSQHEEPVSTPLQEEPSYRPVLRSLNYLLSGPAPLLSLILVPAQAPAPFPQYIATF